MARTTTELTGVQFARILRGLPARPDMTNFYEKELDPSEAKFINQRSHMINWFSQLHTKGAYNRKNPRNARQGYNSLQAPAGLIWIAEALGEDYTTIFTAALEAGGKGTKATQCAIIRQHIPWERIEHLAKKRERKIATKWGRKYAR